MPSENLSLLFSRPEGWTPRHSLNSFIAGETSASGRAHSMVGLCTWLPGFSWSLTATDQSRWLGVVFRVDVTSCHYFAPSSPLTPHLTGRKSWGPNNLPYLLPRFPLPSAPPPHWSLCCLPLNRLFRLECSSLPCSHSF